MSEVVAKIEFRPGNQINEITMINSQLQSNEYVQYDAGQRQFVFPVNSNSNVSATLKPETVLSRPYRYQKNFINYQKSGSRNKLAAYSLNNLSFYFDKENEVQFHQTYQKDLEIPELGNQLDQILHFDDPTMTSTSDIEEEKNTRINPSRKRKFVLVQSNDGKTFSMYKNSPRQNEHQAQRPPTLKKSPYMGSRLLNISNQHINGVPEPTFQSVSPPDLQIEKVDGKYLNASDSTIHQKEKPKTIFL